MNHLKSMPHLALDFMNEDHDAIYQLIEQAKSLLIVAESNESNTPENIQQITRTMQSLLQQCKEHFEREEVQMRECNFPLLAEHQQEHQLILEVTQEAFKAWQENEESTRLKQYMELTLPTWFIGHIDTMDNETALFITSTSVTLG